MVCVMRARAILAFPAFVSGLEGPPDIGGPGDRAGLITPHARLHNHVGFIAERLDAQGTEADRHAAVAPEARPEGEGHGWPESIKEKSKGPAGSSRRGLALTKNRQSWRIEIWLPGTDSNCRPSG